MNKKTRRVETTWGRTMRKQDEGVNTWGYTKTREETT
jgi:hypothetical protein